MDNANDVLTLIVASSPPQVPSIRDRGLQPPTRGVIQRWLGVEKKVDIDTARTNLQRCLQQIRSMLRDMEQEAIEGWELDGLSVSLAISAEGSIGIATAGMQTGIEVSFARADKAEPTKT